MLKEERELLPQLQRLFTRDELVALVGRIMGDRPAEIVEDILRLKVMKKKVMKKVMMKVMEKVDTNDRRPSATMCTGSCAPPPCPCLVVRATMCTGSCAPPPCPCLVVRACLRVSVSVSLVSAARSLTPRGFSHGPVTTARRRPPPPRADAPRRDDKRRSIFLPPRHTDPTAAAAPSALATNVPHHITSHHITSHHITSHAARILHHTFFITFFITFVIIFVITFIITFFTFAWNSGMQYHGSGYCCFSESAPWHLVTNRWWLISQGGNCRGCCTCSQAKSNSRLFRIRLT